MEGRRSGRMEPIKLTIGDFMKTLAILETILSVIGKGFFCSFTAWHLTTTTDVGFFASALIWIGAVTVFFSRSVDFSLGDEK